MTVMSGHQEQLMDTLLEIAGGDVGVVERAFREAAREPGRPPAIEEVVYAILVARGRHDIAEQVREMIISTQEPEPATA